MANKTEQVITLLTRTDKQSLEKLAATYELSVSELVRYFIRNELRKADLLAPFEPNVFQDQDPDGFEYAETVPL